MNFPTVTEVGITVLLDVSAQEERSRGLGSAIIATSRLRNAARKLVRDGYLKPVTRYSHDEARTHLFRLTGQGAIWVAERKAGYR